MPRRRPGNRDGRKGHGDEASIIATPGDPPLLDRLPDGRMRFAKGHKKLGGNRKGSHHRSTQELLDLLHAFNAHGIEGLTKLYDRTAKKAPDKALLAFARFLEYQFPKMRSVELGGLGGGPVVVEIVNLDSAHTVRPAQEATVQAAADEE